MVDNQSNGPMSNVDTVHKDIIRRPIRRAKMAQTAQDRIDMLTSLPCCFEAGAKEQRSVNTREISYSCTL